MDALKQAQGSGIFFDNLFPRNHSSNSSNNNNNNNNNDSSGSQDGSQNGDENSTIKKRNRISFVCKACRRSKTKCDREKPKCGRCVQHGIPCEYDVEKQAAPRNPSKDATIARLEKDVEYWRQKALKLMWEEEEMIKRSEGNAGEQDELQPRSLKRTVSVGGAGIGSNDLHETPILKASRPNGSTVSSRSSTSAGVSAFSPPSYPSSDHVRINLYKSHPSMIMNNVSKREVKPLSENYVITQDMFLTGVLASAFLDGSRQTMLPALSANISVSRAHPSVAEDIFKLKDVFATHCHTPVQLKRLNEFTDRILNGLNPKKGLPMSKMGLMLQNSLETNGLEDFCPPGEEYSDALKEFIIEIEKLLPPYVIIQRYKSHFYQSVFPNVPFLDEKDFEDSLQSMLFPHEADPDKIVLRLGNVKLRDKMGNLCILLLVLKLSFLSLQIMDEASQSLDLHQRENLEKYPISNQTVVIAQKVLVAEKYFSRANENVITCLLYIWAFFVYSPEQSDFLLEHPTDLISGLILTLAMSIGLHRDPSDFPQLRDSTWDGPSVINHRRMLWVSTVTAISLETSLKGRNPVSNIDLMRLFIDIKDPNALQVYMGRVRADISSPVNPSFLQHHEFAFKRLLVAISILDLDRLTLTYDGTFSLSEIEGTRERIVQLLDEHFPMIYLDGDSSESKRNFDSLVANGALPMRIISLLIILRSSLALFLHFEWILPQKPELLPQYREYFAVVCLDLLTLICHTRTFFVNIHKFKSFPMGSYNTAKCIQLALSSAFLSVLLILIRVDLGSHMLLEQYQEDMSNADSESMKLNNQKLEIMSVFKKLLEDTLENIHRAASSQLRFTYFSVFKMLILFDVIVVRMRKGELWKSVLNLQALGDFNTAFLRILNTRFSIDPDDKQSIVKKLRNKNYVNKFSTAELNSIYQRVKAKYDEVPRFDTPRSHELSPSQTPLTMGSKIHEQNNDVGRADKMSSAATPNQHINFGGLYGLTPLNSKIKLEGQDGTSGITPDVGLSDERQLPAPGEFPGLFGGLNLFDYDFLFGNNI
ncbi:hypothetical protein ZYGR_0AI00310 [Zygosaccharomyces rouxii]|uniref:Zn(2)-C6 fungal-type domain-containing protein n=1 Tax=Zygosaccharomyces rouxii TaxID=4956 RepID=A0A1Q3AAI1_ZYGRO|nr:hypothetical protein ZYGR_0AI00310 [Zygosaccharomyces rouxii]